MRFILVISLIVLLMSIFNNPFPQFSESQLQFICVEEGIE